MTQQTTPNHEIELSLLKKIQEQLRDLPEKQKTRYGAKEAVEFLYDDLKTALSKNYTMGEISEILMQSGWEIRENSLKYFLKMFRHEEKSDSDKTLKRKRKQNRKESKKQNEVINPETRSNELEHTHKTEPEEVTEKNKEPKVEQKKLPQKNVKDEKGKDQEKKAEGKNAYFELTPDTDDL